MKILITAGGTTEKIDEVRCITNHSTGAMGSAIAEAFLRLEKTREIIFVCGAASMTPRSSERVRILRVTDVADLQETLRRLLGEEAMDGIVHCMAVSDYTVDSIMPAALLETNIADKLSRADGGPRMAERLPELLDQCLREGSEVAAGGKIRSDMDKLLLVLRKTPKIIGLFKAMQEQAVLVGFKLLNNVTPDVLLEAGVRLMKRNRCDLVFANDKADVTPGRHRGYLISPDGSFEELSGREQIANKIASSVADQVIRKERRS